MLILEILGCLAIAAWFAVIVLYLIGAYAIKRLEIEDEDAKFY